MEAQDPEISDLRLLYIIGCLTFYSWPNVGVLHQKGDLKIVVCILSYEKKEPQEVSGRPHCPRCFCMRGAM